MRANCLIVTLVAILLKSIDSSDIPYSRCLETRTYCQSLPESCLRENGLCNALLIASPADSGQSSVEFELFGRPDASRHYFAIALSDDRLMGNDSVTEIYVTTDGTQRAVRHSWNQRRGNTPLNDNQVNGITVNQVNVLDNGIVSGKWTRSAISRVNVDQSTYEFDLKTSKYYLMLVDGPVSGDNKLRHHSERSVSEVGVDLLFTNENELKGLYEKCSKLSEVDYCYGLPDGCVAKKNCKIVLAVINTGYGLTDQTISFQLIGETEDANSGWVAVGLSQDQNMGSDAVVDCLALKNSKTQLTNSWNEGHKNVPVGDVAGVTATGNVINEDKLINCKWTRTVTTQVNKVTFDLKNSQYYLLLAKGPISDSGSSPVAVNLTSSEPSPPTTAPNSSLIEQAYQRCKDEKSLCFGYKKGVTDCVGQQNCLVLFSSVPKGEGAIEAELFWEKGSDASDNWVAVALSNDQTMGSDHITECIVQNGSPVVRTGVNPDGTNPTKNVVDSSITALTTSFTDNLVYCKWNRSAISNLTVDDKNYYFDILDNSYYLFLAYGPMGSGEQLNHHTDKTFSSSKVNLQSVGIIKTGVNVYVQVHAALMTIAWLGCVSIAILLARHFKGAWPDATLCGVKIWFAFHRLLMVFGVTLILISFVVILVNKKGWVGASAHPVIGLMSIILSFLQPIGALFRPGPDASFRYLFNWLHWSGGYIGHTLAFIAILLSTNFDGLLPESFFWILISLIIIYVFSHISLLHLRPNKERNGNDLKDMNESNTSDTLVVSLISLVITSLVVALVVLIFV